MAGVSKPSEYMQEAKFTYGTKSGTDYSLTLGTISGFFDGVNANTDSGNSAYFGNSGNYIILDIKERCNIWRSGTTSWSHHYKRLFVYKYNESSGAYDINVTNTYTLTTTAINEKQWEMFIKNIPSGKYKFTYGDGYRLDTEWFLELATNPNFLKCDNEYYIPTATYYNQETKMFNSVSQSEAYTSTSLIDMNSKLTINDETFFIYQKFLSKNVVFGYNEEISTTKKMIHCYCSENELIVGKGTISLKPVGNIDKYTLGYTKTHDNTICMAFSLDDGDSWLSYDFNNAEFVNLDVAIPLKNYKLMTIEERQTYKNAKNKIITNGVFANDLPYVNWNLLKNDNGDYPENIRFAYVIIKTSFEDETNVTDLTWQFDARGVFEPMKKSEYDLRIYNDEILFYGYLNNEIIKINIK